MGIQTQICGLILLSTVLLLKIMQPHSHDWTHKTFTALLITAILGLMLDGYSIIVIKHANGSYGLFPQIICRSYLVSLDILVSLSFFYLTTDLRKDFPKIIKLRKIYVAWTGLFVILNCTLPIKFFNEDGKVFTYDLAVYVTYILAATILITNLIVLARYKKSMNDRRWIAGLMWMIIWILATSIQLMRNDLLLVGFGSAIGITIVFFKMETPDYQNLIKTMKELEDSRKEADEANKAKSNFLAQMSHEIRTPINAVLGMNEMILREAKDETISYYASNAYNSGKALLSIINDILDISKIEAGKLEIVNEDYDLYSLITDCYHMTSERAEAKGLKFIYDVEENLPAKLCGDMFHIRQIIVNFLTNAIKYTDEGSVVMIFSGEEIKGEDDSENLFALKVSVQDTGIGLEEESIKNLFTSFQRFDLKRNQSVEGTGLGLSICKELSELMNGKIDVESVYGEGSTFSCTIPQVIVDKTPIGKIVLKRSLKNPELFRTKKFTSPDSRLLVVDDVEMNLIVFKNLLKEHKFQIDTALSGRQCLELIQENKYDVIFMDHMMPDMDGIETFERMKITKHLNNETPVVMLTANAISGEKEKYLLRGFVSYLTKPIQSEKLEDTLLHYLPEKKIIWGESENAEPKENISTADLILNAKINSEILDITTGLNYAGNKIDAYQMVLESYVKNGDDKASKIAALKNEENWKDYVTQVHALKSTSLTIGAKKLSELAKELETAGKNGEYEIIKNKNDALLEQYKKVLLEGEKILTAIKESSDKAKNETKQKKEKSEIAKDALQEYYEKIKNAISSFDSDEIVSQCESLSDFTFNGINLEERLRKIKDAANDFEFEEIEKLSEELFGEIL